MSKHLAVCGHGQGDPGAMGNGYGEAEFTRTILKPKMEAWAKKLKHNSIEWYDTSKDMYQNSNAGGGAYSVSTSYASVTEFHLDAVASGSATGGHVIISSQFSPDANDLAIAKVLEKYVGLWGSSKPTGTYKRNDLLNLNVFAKRGISYRLVELGFISSKKDVDNIVKNIDAIAKGMVEAITGEKIEGGSSNNNSNNNAKPSTPKTHDQIIAESKPKTVGNYVGKLEVFNELKWGIFRIAGWLVPINGAPYLNHGYVFWKEAGTGKEIGRCPSKGIMRNDANKAYGLPNGLKFGLDGTLDIKKFAGKKVYPCLRRTNDKAGNSIAGKANGNGWIDIEFPEYVLTIPKR